MAEVVTVLWSIEDSYNANTMALVRPFVSVLSEVGYATVLWWDGAHSR